MGRDLRVAAFSGPDAPDDSAAAFRGLQREVDIHLPLSSDPLARWSGTLLTTRDGLPLVGPVEGLPVVLLLGLGTLGHSWAFVAARWIAEGLAGRPGVPALFRSGRASLRVRVTSDALQP